jgi:hypothetical protein
VKHRYQNKNNLQKTGFLVQKYISKKALSIAALASLFACSAYAMQNQADLDSKLVRACNNNHTKQIIN